MMGGMVIVADGASVSRQGAGRIPALRVGGRWGPARIAILVASVLAAGTLATDRILAEDATNNFSREESLSAAETALKRAHEIEKEKGPELRQQEAVALWRDLLDRKDLTDEQRVFVLWRIGSISAYNFDRSKGDRTAPETAAAALKEALGIVPSLVTRETINAASIYGSLAGSARDRAVRAAEAYRWLMTRTDSMIGESAARVQGFGYGQLLGPKIIHLSGLELTAEERASKIRKELAEYRTNFERYITGFVTYTAEQDPAAVLTLLKSIEDIAPPAQMKQWREKFAEIDEKVGFSGKLSEQVRRIGGVPPLGTEPRSGDLDTGVGGTPVTNTKPGDTPLKPEPSSPSPRFLTIGSLAAIFLLIVAGTVVLLARHRKRHHGT